MFHRNMEGLGVLLSPGGKLAASIQAASIRSVASYWQTRDIAEANDCLHNTIDGNITPSLKLLASHIGTMA